MSAMFGSRREPIERQAVRLLFIMRYCGEQLDQPLPLFELFEYWIESEIKLQKLDFWVRYPDYLSYNLLSGIGLDPKLTKRRDEIKDIVKQIFLYREPVIRCVPMQRFLRGAYEPVDHVMSFLVSRSLVRGRRLQQANRNAFYLTGKGAAVVEQLRVDCPETQWYVTRCQLIYSFFGHLSGNKIREIQYDNSTYRLTKLTNIIRSVEPEVRQMYQELFGEELA
jgi:hypothetical protein